MAAAASLRFFVNGPAALRPLATHRAAQRVVVTMRNFSARAQAGGEDKESAAVAPAAEQQQRAVAPRSAMEPSFARVNQVFREMESEMNALSRAFGMPAMPSLSSPMFDLPSSAADLPALTAKSMAVDIKDSDKELEIVADVPGMAKEDIKVQVSPDKVLTISGERRSEHREGSEEEGNLRIERSHGSFMRRFRLPDAIDVDGIKANVKDGVLRLNVPKTEAAKPKEIDVNVTSE